MNTDLLRTQLWGAANEIDGLKNRIQNAADVLEIMAVSETTEPHSGALWFVRDSIKTLCELMDFEVDKLMEVSRQLHEEEPKKKKVK
jgi:hypothetical protein